MPERGFTRIAEDAEGRDDDPRETLASLDSNFNRCALRSTFERKASDALSQRNEEHCANLTR